MKKIHLITTTVEQKEDAKKIASQLLAQNCIACAQISGPITSIYRWEGVINTSEEFMLTLKTTESKSSEVKRFIETNHPYDLPEVIVQYIEESSPEYTSWVYEEVR